jgi:hypothetical protein
MLKKRFLHTIFPGAVCAMVLHAAPALATQSHGEPEGLVAHQLAHLFFIFAMGTLAFWLKERYLTEKSGWRFIQYAAIMLILWNIDAFAVHMMDEYTNILTIQRLGNWQIRIFAESGYEALEIVYYLAKLDHLLCVPALFLLYLGLRRLAREEEGRVQ